MLRQACQETQDPVVREKDVLLSSIQSLYDCRAEVIIKHAPSTSDACTTGVSHPADDNNRARPAGPNTSHHYSLQRDRVKGELLLTQTILERGRFTLTNFSPHVPTVYSSLRDKNAPAFWALRRQRAPHTFSSPTRRRPPTHQL